MTAQADRPQRRRDRGGRARTQGRTAEVVAAFWLMAHGYRILGFRMKLAGVEVDLAVRRRDVLAVVEVKRRRTLQAALEAVTPVQQARLRRAGSALAARSRAAGVVPSVRLDLLALAPGRLPQHVADAWGDALGTREAGRWP
ncbi:YraN family protein [Caulobacter sp. S45]|uniref:YraN family protein n=1 Tax=Caulobacter sp. S45 TaxID=1641861 RepID=UPI001575E5A3|nr:YraN family protein [Caulobacter sp. S45]